VKPEKPSRIQAYAVATICVTAAFAIRSALAPLLMTHAPLMLFILAAMIAAYYGGAGPGIAATVVGELLGDYFFVPPYHTLGPNSVVQWAYCITFVAITGGAIAIIEALRRARNRAQKSSQLAQTRGEQLRSSLREIGQAEAKIRELASVVETAQDAILSLSLDGRVKSWNAGAEGLFGYTAAEILGESFLCLIPPDRLEEHRELWNRLQEGERINSFETVRLNKRGEEIDVSITLSPMRDEQGRIAGASAIIRDLSEIKRTASALRESEQRFISSRQALETERSRYRELFNSAPVGYIITSAQGVIQQVNHAAAAVLNEDPDFLAGLPLAHLLAREHRPAFFTNLGRLTRAEAQQIDNWEALIQPRQRRAFHASLIVNRIENEHGSLIGLRWIVKDITQQRQAEQKILRLNAELEKRVCERTEALETANRELEAFSYSVSHDLRAPIRSIVGFTSALAEDYGDKLEAEGAKYLQYTHEAGLRMNRLVDDLMELSRATRRELRQKEVDLSELAGMVLADLQNRDPQRNVEVNIAPGLVGRGDEGLLRIALENLLGNAWKFTARRNQARIEFGVVAKNGSQAFFVRDNGAGFSMAHAARLFGVFQRLHSVEDFPGTGIGLATVRRIFTRHGGQVWAESEVGKGATFYFSLPNTQTTNPATKEPDQRSAEGNAVQKAA